MPEQKAWTIHLGELIRELSQQHAPEAELSRAEDELAHAIHSVRFVRRCYNIPSQHLAEHE